MARSMKIVFCSFGCIRKSIGVNKSYPTDPGVAWWGLIAFSDKFWKYVSSTKCPWSSLDWVRSWAPVIQKSLPAPSCLGVSRICGLVEGPGRHPSRFLSFAPGGFLLHGLWACPR